MNRALYTAALALGGLAFLMAAQTANADLLQKDSSAFSWKYEMTVDPNSQDLDDNGAPDFNAVVTGNGGTVGFADGIMTVNESAAVNAYGYLSSPTTYPVNPHIWENNIDRVTGFTLEFRAKVLSQKAAPDGQNGAFNLTASTSGDIDPSPAASLCFGANSVDWGNIGGDPGAYTLSTGDNTDAFHTFRIAKLPDSVAADSYYVWRDGVLIGNGISSVVSYWSYTLNIGDLGGMSGGNFAIDYVRFTTNAFAPVPEPSSVILLVSGLVGLLAYAWRKRK